MLYVTYYFKELSMVKVLVIACLFYNFCALVATDSQIEGTTSSQDSPRTRASSLSGRNSIQELIKQETQFRTEIKNGMQESTSPNQMKTRSKSFSQVPKEIGEAS
jgi:hypothetical protein